MYRNKSKAFEVCKEMLKLMNSNVYLALIIYYAQDIFESDSCFDDSIRSKAAYMKTDNVVIESNADELKKLMKPELENEVRIQGMFREETINTICYFKESGVDIFPLWFMNKPENTEEIAVKAFKKFDTIKNSETYPLDTLACQLLVSECVRGYFDIVLMM